MESDADLARLEQAASDFEGFVDRQAAPVRRWEEPDPDLRTRVVWGSCRGDGGSVKGLEPVWSEHAEFTAVVRLARQELTGVSLHMIPARLVA